VATTPSWVAAGTLVATATNGASLSPVPPNGSIGDFLLLVLERNDTTAAPSVTNWTNVAALTSTNGTSSTAVYYRYATSATGSVDAPSAITFGSSTVARAGVILRFANVDPISPIHQATLNNVASTATTVNATNITSTLDNTLAVFIATMIGARSTTNTTTNWTAGAGVTAFASQNTTVGNDETIGYGSKQFDTAGSYLSPGIVWTTNTTTGVGQGLLLGLNAVGPPITATISTFDTQRPSIGVYATKWRPFRGVTDNSQLPIPTARGQVSWAAIETPDAAPSTPLPTGEQSFELPPRASPRSRDYSYVYQAQIPNLVGQDAVNPGEQFTDLPPRAYPRSRDYTFLKSFELGVFQELPPGDQSTALPPRAPARSRDYTYLWPAQTQLIGQDAMATGEQSTELPPRAPARQRDYTWLQSFELNVFQELPYGQQATALPPRAAPRAASLSDPGANFTLALDAAAQATIPVGQSSLDLPPRSTARSRDYTWLHPSDTQLIGQDALVTGVQTTALPPRGYARAASLSDPGANYTLALDLAAQAILPQGKATFEAELPPRGPARSRDYSFEYQAQIPNLVGTDATVTGRNTFGTELPTRAPSRHRDYTWLQSFSLSAFQELPYGAQLTGNAPRGYQRAASLYDPLANNTLIPDFIAAQAPPPGKTSRDTELPPRGYLRSRDYSFVHPADVQLIGQDAMATGQSTLASDLPPRAPSRQRDYTWFQTYDLPIFEQLPAGAQLSGNAPRGYARASSLYEPGENFAIELSQVQGPLSQQVTELPPRGAQRSRDYSFTDQAIVPQLIGQDAVNPGKSTDATALPPRGPQRSKDYTWLQSMPLHVFQELPPGDSTLVTESPPKGPLRLKDYTFLNVNVGYIGQDTMYGAPGEVPTYDWPNPIPYRRPINVRDFVNPQVLFTGKPVTPGTVLAGSSLTATVLAGSSALGSVLGGASQTEI